MTRNKNSPPTETRDDPAALRRVFGENLKALCADHPSIAGLSRQLGINRTQFNRYMTGESFPRPDILHRICEFFDVDARILLEPVTELQPAPDDLLGHPFLSGFFSRSTVSVPAEFFPSGFYRFARKSFLDSSNFVLGLVMITRRDGFTFLRGFVPRNALREKGLSTDPYFSEYRGLVMRREDGVMALVAHRDSLACSFNFLTPETSFQSNLWEGYASRVVREKVTGIRATRMVYEHLGESTSRVLAAARESGVVSEDGVPPIYLHLLRPDAPFR